MWKDRNESRNEELRLYCPYLGTADEDQDEMILLAIGIDAADGLRKSCQRRMGICTLTSHMQQHI